MKMTGKPFRIGLTRDFLKPDGTIGFGDIGLSLLDAAPDVTWEFLSETAAELKPEQIANGTVIEMIGRVKQGCYAKLNDTDKKYIDGVIAEVQAQLKKSAGK